MHPPIDTDHTRLDMLARGLVEGARAGRREGASAVVAAVQRPGAPAAIAVAGRTCLPGVGDERPVTRGTLFDVASVTKVVTTLVAATTIEDGTLDPDAPITEHLGPGHVPDGRITARHLLTHTAGLPPELALWEVPGGRDARRAAIRRAPVLAEPGTAHAYSCVGFVLLGLVLESLGHSPLPRLAADRVLGPLGAHTVTWSPPAHAPVAATERQLRPPRGLIQGQVHDETAWSLSGPGQGAGNAGAFADAAGLLVIGRELAGSTDRLALSPALRAMLTTDQLGDDIEIAGPWRQGLGLRIGHELPDRSRRAHLVGHPGFTGVSLLADPRTGSTGVLVTNRVHPHRERFEVAGARRALAGLVAGR